MRIIKFRAWDEDRKKMFFFGEQPYVFSGAKLIWLEFQAIHPKDGTVTADTHYSNAKLMQFTGLLDKNGKDVYESDILEWSARDNDGRIMKQRDLVSWKNGSFVTGEGNDEESFYDDGNRKQITKQSAVIGNLYETPELINPRQI